MSGKVTANDIFDKIRTRVRCGDILPGEVLPPVRELATSLRINKNTVANAYKKLIYAGIAEANGRKGTSVRQLSNLPPQEGPHPDTVLTDISGGNPAPSMLLPLQHFLSAVNTTPRLYGASVINPGLEEFGQSWFAPVVSEQFGLTLTHGTVDALERLLTGFINKRERVAVEDPCFLGSKNTLLSLGVTPVAIRMDNEGVRPEELHNALTSGAQAVIITARAQNPTGFSLSARRAAEIRAILAQYPQVLIIIDDHFSLISCREYHNVIPVSSRHWAVIRSFSKFLGPDFRMALVASDQDTSLRLKHRLASGTHWVSHLLQDIAEAALTSPKVNQHFNTARHYYREKREFFIREMNKHGLSHCQEGDGINVWLSFTCSCEPIIDGMKNKGWIIRNGNDFSVGHHSSSVRLTLTTLSTQQISNLAEDLAVTIRQVERRN